MRQLTVKLKVGRQEATALDDVSFDVRAGETFCLVGESGSGKSLTAMAIMRLLSRSTFGTQQGRIVLQGRDLMAASEAELSDLRGHKLSIVFQDPMSALNPVLSIGRQLSEPLRQHLKLDRDQASARAVELLRLVGLPSAETAVARYPHELSGGQRQRVMIAMALACEPQLVIADEPTTALDVTTQAQILSLLSELQTRLGMALLLITHDLGVVAEMADHVAVMYAGRIVEVGTVANIFERPRHPYTQGLLLSIPPLDGQRAASLPSIGGVVPSLMAMPSGCAFAPRCPQAINDCRNEVPAFRVVGSGHSAACIRAQTDEGATHGE